MRILIHFAFQPRLAPLLNEPGFSHRRLVLWAVRCSNYIFLQSHTITDFLFPFYSCLCCMLPTSLIRKSVIVCERENTRGKLLQRTDSPRKNRECVAAPPTLLSRKWPKCQRTLKCLISSSLISADTTHYFDTHTRTHNVMTTFIHSFIHSFIHH